MQSLIPRFLRQLLDFKAIPDGKWLAKEDGNVVGMDAPESSGGLTYFEEVRNTSSPNGTVPVHALRAVGDETDIDVALVPKGTGAILAAIPDGTTAGGNKRGTESIDITRSPRASAAGVASGTNSIAVGKNCRAGSPRTVAIGMNSEAIGGWGYSVAIGDNAKALNSSTVAIGSESCRAEHPSAIAVGRAILANHYLAVAMGNQCASFNVGTFHFSPGPIVSGRTKATILGNLACVSSGDTPVEMLILGGAILASSRFFISSGTAVEMTLSIMGVRDDGGASARYCRRLGIANVSGTTAMMGPVEAIGSDHEDDSTSVSISADDTNDALKVEVTGIAEQSWTWVGSFFGSVFVL